VRRTFPLLLLLAACAPGETADPPVPDPLPTPLTTVATPGAAARREKTETLTCFPELPPGAEEALLSIRTAAEAGDLEALRGWLAGDVNWSFGGEAGADRAIRHWREHPEVLRELVATLDRGCLEDETGRRVTCPPEYRRDPSYLGWRAGLERRPDGWRMTFFVAGD
jgi:hypothetical protein